MRLFGFVWGIAGVAGILLYAVYRLTPMAVELFSQPLNPPRWAALVLFTGFMAYSEGYKGFHKAFAPRVVARAEFLRNNRRPLLSLLAPLFCMGYFHATRKRIMSSLLLTAAIIALVVLVRLLSQPWRGIVDAGVVVGLLLGVASIAFFTVKALTGPGLPQISPDLPADT